MVEELARVYCKRGQARRLAVDAGLDKASIPDFTTPGVFWADVIEDVGNGALPVASSEF